MSKTPKKTKTRSRRKTRIYQLAATPEVLQEIAAAIAAPVDPTPDDSIPTKMDITVRPFAAPSTIGDAVAQALTQEWVKQETQWPADWWQHFKQRWFPCWAKARWPVQMEIKTWYTRSENLQRLSPLEQADEHKDGLVVGVAADPLSPGALCKVTFP